MSRRHQVRRRHAYGRRQHEIREREVDGLGSFDGDLHDAAEDAWDGAPGGLETVDAFGSLRDLLRPGLRWAQDRG